MALRKTISAEGVATVNTPFGNIENGNQSVVFSAYIKVSSIGGTKEIINATVDFIGEKIKFTKHYQVPVSVNENSTNFIKQVYEHLKTLPEFSCAENV